MKTLVVIFLLMVSTLGEAYFSIEGLDLPVEGEFVIISQTPIHGNHTYNNQPTRVNFLKVYLNSLEVQFLSYVDIEGAYNCHFHAIRPFFDFEDHLLWLHDPTQIYETYFTRVFDGHFSDFRGFVESLEHNDVIAFYDEDMNIVHSSRYIDDGTGLLMTTNKFGANPEGNATVGVVLQIYSNSRYIQVYRFNEDN